MVSDAVVSIPHRDYVLVVVLTTSIGHYLDRCILDAVVQHRYGSAVAHAVTALGNLPQ